MSQIESQSIMNPRYIFLDNWVLSDFTKSNKVKQLSEFIRRHNYRVLISTLSPIELYNPDWGRAKVAEEERVTRVTRFFAQHPCIIVNPGELFAAEIKGFPNPLEQIPVRIDFANLPSKYREEAFLMLMRRGKLFLDMGIDIDVWAKDYHRLTSNWLDDKEKIVKHACNQGTLKQNPKGNFIQLEDSRENFLQSLDRRHLKELSLEEQKELGENLISLFMGATDRLPAVRFTSRCFWYSYIDKNKSHLTSEKNSDIGDFYNLSLLPYCSAFTVDKNMEYIIEKRILPETGYNCEIIAPRNIDTKLTL